VSEPGFWIRFLLAVLATWRVTHLLVSEDGPGDLIAYFRKRLGHGIAGKLMDCFQCLSLWVAAPMVLFVSLKLTELPLVWLALSGAACLLERWGGEPVVMQPLAEGDLTNGMLRPETRTDAERPAAGGNGAGFARPS